MAVVTVTSAAVVTTEAAVTAASTTAKIQQAADHAPFLQPPLPSLDSPTQGNPMSTNLSGVEYKSENGLHICQEVMCTSPAIRQPLGACLHYPTSSCIRALPCGSSVIQAGSPVLTTAPL